MPPPPLAAAADYCHAMLIAIDAERRRHFR